MCFNYWNVLPQIVEQANMVADVEQRMLSWQWLNNQFPRVLFLFSFSFLS